jgi:hypothetical protein
MIRLELVGVAGGLELQRAGDLRGCNQDPTRAVRSQDWPHPSQGWYSDTHSSQAARAGLCRKRRLVNAGSSASAAFSQQGLHGHFRMSLDKTLGNSFPLIDLRL